MGSIQKYKERTVTLNLTDEDCERVSELCALNDVSVSELLANFIGDLVGRSSSHGCDERVFAQAYFDRCCYDVYGQETLLKWLIRESIDIKEFLELTDELASAYEELREYEQNPEDYAEDIECMKQVISYKEEELDEYRAGYPLRCLTWEEEVANVRKWFDGLQQFKGGMA